MIFCRFSSEIILVLSLRKDSISSLSPDSMKNEFNFSATSVLSIAMLSFSIRMISLGRDFCLSENKKKRGFTLCQKVLLSSSILGSKSL